MGLPFVVPEVPAIQHKVGIHAHVDSPVSHMANRVRFDVNSSGQWQPGVLYEKDCEQHLGSAGIKASID